jgi:hypothetical protein
MFIEGSSYFYCMHPTTTTNMFLSKAFSMKSINMALVFSLLSITNAAYSSNEPAAIIEKLSNTDSKALSILEIPAFTQTASRNPIAFKNADGVNALVSSAKEGSLLKCQILILGGADRAYNEQGLTAINIACLETSITPTILQNLKNFGAQLDTKNRNNETPAEFAIKNNLPSIIKLLPQHPGDHTGLMFALAMHKDIACKFQAYKNEKNKFNKHKRLKDKISSEKLAKIESNFYENHCFKLSPLTKAENDNLEIIQTLTKDNHQQLTLDHDTKSYIQQSHDLMKIPMLKNAVTDSIVVYKEHTPLDLSIKPASKTSTDTNSWVLYTNKK